MSRLETEKPAAVIVGLDCITGLQTARLLRGRGVQVYGIASNPSHFAARTNACRRVVRADTSAPEVIDALLSLTADLDHAPVLYPCTDNAVLRLSEQRSRLEGEAHLALPSHEVVERLIHKPSMLEHALEHGFNVPRSVDVRCRADIERALAELTFPCTLKPAATDARWTSRTKIKAFKADSPDELLRHYETCRSWSDHLVAQRWIEGPESELYSCNCYFGQDGQPLATFVARKIRQWPPETGTSALGVECRADAVRDETLRLFESVGHRGLGYVEMKRDRRSGEWFLIEPNVGRPTGRSAIAEAGGVELLYTMYCDLSGRPLPREREQQQRDAKWIYLRHDLQAAFHGWRQGDLGPAEWWRSMRGRKTFAVYSSRDPLPFLLDNWKAVRTAARSLSLDTGRGTASAPTASLERNQAS